MHGGGKRGTADPGCVSAVARHVQKCAALWCQVALPWASARRCVESKSLAGGWESMAQQLVCVGGRQGDIRKPRVKLI